jgi:hypothetical protein
MEYPAKVLMAWGEAISGNQPLKDWLAANGYGELAMACHAIRNHGPSRNWLMENRQQHLMAMIRGAEGDKAAISWLRSFGFEYLALVAEGADNMDEAVKTLLEKNQREWAGLALKIRSIKNQIEGDHNSAYKISRS